MIVRISLKNLALTIISGLAVNASAYADSEGACSSASLINPYSIQGGIGGTGMPANGGVGGTGAPLAKGGVAGTGAPVVAKGGVAGTGAPLENGGISGTGSPVATGGVGGTGDAVATGGVGGTGAPIAKGGIGGTGDSIPAYALLPDDAKGSIGIMGVVTGFASICVNGEEVQYDSSTPIYENGKIAKLADIAVGKTVMLKVDKEGDGLRARAIGLFNAVTGPVSDLNVLRQEVTVMGQTIQVNRSIIRQLALALAENTSGTVISISGYRSDSGAIVASRVDIVDSMANANTLGLVTHIMPNGFVINGTKVHVTNPRALEKVKVGSEVQVSGNWNNGILKASRVDIQPINNIVNRVDVAIMEGFVRSSAQNNMAISGTEVTSAPGLDIAKQLDEYKDKLVKVEMRRNQKGEWVTDKITEKRSKRVDYQIQFKDENATEKASAKRSGSGSSGSGSSGSGSSGSGSSGSGSSGSGSSGSGSSGSGSSGSGSSGSVTPIRVPTVSVPISSPVPKVSGSGSSGSFGSGSSGSSGSGSSGSSGSGSSGSSGSGKKN